MQAGKLALNFKVHSVKQQCDTTTSVCTRKIKFIKYVAYVADSKAEMTQPIEDN